MRLKVSVASANDELAALINEGYNLLENIHLQYRGKKNSGMYDEQEDDKEYSRLMNEWASKVL